MTEHPRNGDAEKQAVRTARAARMRAARAFADIDQATLAEHLDVAVISIKRMERGTRDISLDDMHAIAELCDVPRAFMEEGFGTAYSGDEVRREDLRELQEAFEARIAELAQALLTREEAQSMSREALGRLVHGGAAPVVRDRE